MARSLQERQVKTFSHSATLSFRVYALRCWWIRVVGYGELFYNSTLLRQAVGGRCTCSLQIVISSSHRHWHFKVSLFASIPKYIPRDTISCKQPTLSKQHFRCGEHNPINVKTIFDVKTIIDVNTTTLSILFETKHSLGLLLGPKLDLNFYKR